MGVASTPSTSSRASTFDSITGSVTVSEEVLNIFDLADRDHSGYITWSEFSSLLFLYAVLPKHAVSCVRRRLGKAPAAELACELRSLYRCGKAQPRGCCQDQVHSTLRRASAFRPHLPPGLSQRHRGNEGCPHRALAQPACVSPSFPKSETACIVGAYLGAIFSKRSIRTETGTFAQLILQTCSLLHPQHRHANRVVAARQLAVPEP